MIKKHVHLIYLIMFLVLLSGCSANSPKISCPEGYTATHVPHLTTAPEYYCKTDKQWADFKECSSQQECGDLEECISPDKETETRCVPTKHYQMSCWCYINNDCVCT